tara:strand:- start:87 stop:644 length:558 start_codon:yes stop_codon:yes gene_type:complete
LFEIEKFIQNCKEVINTPDSYHQIRELVTSAVMEKTKIIHAFGEPKRGGVNRIYVSQELTILNLVWAPRMTLKPHNHNMWAVIGIYTGREDNIFWRRIKGSVDGKLEAAGAKSLGEGDVVPLGSDIVHSVTNPLNRCTGALHVYGGNFFEEPRSEWDPENLKEKPYDVESNMALFEEANRFFDKA